jgi:hypothetical protein
MISAGIATVRPSKASKSGAGMSLILTLRSTRVTLPSNLRDGGAVGGMHPAVAHAKTTGERER